MTWLALFDFNKVSYAMFSSSIPNACLEDACYQMTYHSENEMWS